MSVEWITPIMQVAAHLLYTYVYFCEEWSLYVFVFTCSPSQALPVDS